MTIMKKIVQYIVTLLLLLIVGTSCEDNANWRIITDVQQGTYITGTATIYSAVATSSALTAAPLDNAPEGTNVIGIYTWLKADGEFTILKADAEGKQVTYGKGSVVATKPFETVALVADGTPFKVTKDGLYYVAYNVTDGQLTILPAEFGIIGDATPSKWDAETVMSTVAYDENQATVTFSMKDQVLDKKEMKFRYAQMWGAAIPYGASTVTVHTNMGLSAAAAASISAAYSACKGGGANFKVDKKGTYDIALKLDLKTALFSARAVLTGEDTSSAELPTKIFINGSPYSSGWDWALSHQMTAIHSHEGMFWSIQYYEADAKIKFNNAMSWDGNDFGAPNEDAVGFGTYDGGKSNLKIKDTGFYLVIVTASLSEDKKSVVYKVTLAEPKVYLMGDCAEAGYNIAESGLFTVANGLFTSPVVKAGNLRMCVAITGVDWWQAEFNVSEGAIAYRGAGGDLASVPVTAGKIVKLNFKNDTAAIE